MVPDTENTRITFKIWLQTCIQVVCSTSTSCYGGHLGSRLTAISHNTHASPVMPCVLLDFKKMGVAVGVVLIISQVQNVILPVIAAIFDLRPILTSLLLDFVNS